MAGGRPPARNLNKRPFWGSLFLRRRETIPVCHALLQDIKFFKLLLHIDHELAAQTRGVGCPCGGILHQANYPRKPRGCPNELRSVYASRFSFSCNRCRKRATSQSVRFLGRRVYLALAVVLVWGPRARATRADTSGDATRQGVGHAPAHRAALARLVARSIPALRILASDLRPFHAAAGDRRVARQSARTLWRGDGRTHDAAAGLPHPHHGRARDHTAGGALITRRRCA
jgi:hypothetical protein